MPAILSLGALLLLAPVEVAAPVEREADEVEVPAPVEPEPVEPEPTEPGPTPEPAPAPAAAAPATARVSPAEKPRPKWWGPFPRPKVTGFGGPVLQLTGFNGGFGAMVGLGGGLTIRRRVSLGGVALWLLNPIEAGTTLVGAPQRLNVSFGGLLLAVVFARTERIDFTVEGLLGGGGACLQNPNNGHCYARTAMFVGQPGLGMHIRLAPVVRLALGLGYRLVAARGWSGPDSRHLGAPVGNIMLEFGWF